MPACDFQDQLSRYYSEDCEYARLLKIKDFEAITQGLAEIREQIAELKEIGVKNKDRSFSLRARIKTLELYESSIRRRYNSMMQSKLIKIQNRRERKKESDFVSSLISVVSGMEVKPKRKRYDEIPTKSQDNLLEKQHLSDPEIQAKAACDYAISQGIDLNTLDKEVVLAGGYGFMLDDYFDNSTPKADEKPHLIIEEDENGIKVAKYSDGSKDGQGNITKQPLGNSFLDDLAILSKPEKEYLDQKQRIVVELEKAEAAIQELAKNKS